LAAGLNEKVLALVERELRKDPGIQTKQLKEKAVKIDKSVAQLSGRQFHARYALQARRRLFGVPGRRGKTTRSRRGRSHAVQQLVTESYDKRRARLEAAIDQAFQRAMEADSIGRVNRLLAALDRHARELEKA
jgi:Skp family chaperone for outer membrane proteins